MQQKARHRSWRVVLLVLAMCASLLSFISQPSVAAPSIWTQEVEDVNPSELQTGLNGTVTAARCNSTAGPLFQRTFDSGGQALHSTPNDASLSLCDNTAVVAKDGALFGLWQDARDHVVAYRQGVERWRQSLNGDCGSDSPPPLRIERMVLGADDYLYVQSQQQNCTSYTYLTKLKPSDGSVVWHKQIGTTGVTWLSAYSGGVVLLQGQNTVRHFAPTGVEAASYTLSDAASNRQVLSATPDGRLYVASRVSPNGDDSCYPATYTTQIVGVGLRGRVFEYRPPACNQAHVAVAPSGVAVATVIAGDAAKLVALDPTGKVTAETTLPSSVGAKHYYGVGGTLMADANGNVLLQRVAYTNWDNKFYEFSLLNPKNLDVLQTVTTADLELIGTTTVATWAPSDNRLYVVARHCNGPCAAKLYAVPMVGLGLDSPRGSILTSTQPSPIAEKQVVVIGDSFASGEGAGKYDPDTDHAETPDLPENRCHRSELAYANLLDKSSTVKLKLQRSAACSGAEADMIWEKWPEEKKKNTDEAPQADRADKDTDIVTLSIGGNDIGFKDLVVSCLFVDCSRPSVKLKFQNRVTNVGEELQRAYDRVLEQAPNAQIYVVGYPQLFSATTDCPKAGGWMHVFELLVKEARRSPLAFAKVQEIARDNGLMDAEVAQLVLSGKFEFNKNERLAARDIAQRLNAKIDSVVRAHKAAPRLKFVDPTKPGSPFIGHELCTSKPYFNGLDVLNQAHSFHPNPQGYVAYQKVLEGVFR